MPMESKINEIVYDVTLEPGEVLSIPPNVGKIIGPGHWLVCIKPAEESFSEHVRDHAAFLNSYSVEDEGLYDDYSAG